MTTMMTIALNEWTLEECEDEKILREKIANKKIVF